MSKSSQESFYNSSEIDQGCRSTLIHYTNSETCKNLVKVSATTKNFTSKGKNKLSVNSNVKHQVINRINLLDREPEVLQWQNIFSVEPTT